MFFLPKNGLVSEKIQSNFSLLDLTTNSLNTVQRIMPVAYSPDYKPLE
jgi:hypothetical protein